MKGSSTVSLHYQAGSNIWEVARKNNCKPESLMDFSTNINPLGPSPLAIDAMRRGICMVRHYPDPDALRLKLKLSRFLNVPMENLLLGNGAVELIYALCHVIKPKRLLLPVPTSGHYHAAMPDIPVKPIILSAQDAFALPVQLLASTIEPGDALFICNPNNPTGNIVSRKDLLELADKAHRVGALLIVDEGLMDFVEESETVLPEGLKNPAMIVIGSLTKFFALPGLRLGYLVAGRQILDSVERQLPPFRVNSLAQMAGEASLEDINYIMTSLALISREKDFMYSRLKDMLGLRPFHSHANFLLVDCWNTGKTAQEISNQLAKKCILVQVADNYAGLNKYYFRVTIRQRNDNLQLLHELWNILK
jgi:threonine-phosphate decarboxylase